MRKNKIKYLVVVQLLMSSFAINAEWDTSLALDVPFLNVGVERGYITENNSYLSASIYLGLGAGLAVRNEINWSRQTSEDDSHWMGVGVGHMQDADRGFISLDIGSYWSANYKYYKNGLRSSGYHFYISVKGTSEGAIPWIGVGHNF